MVKNTIEQFDEIVAGCQALFLKKHADYGSAWRILRPSSLTDQLYIKASRIRQLEENDTQMVEDSIDSEYVGLINYCVMAMIQLELGAEVDIKMDAADLKRHYSREIEITRSLLQAKNHDYGEVWREMRISSITDLILMKILRIKSIEDNNGQTLVSEGLAANFRDIINYAIFALILRSETIKV